MPPSSLTRTAHGTWLTLLSGACLLALLLGPLLVAPSPARAASSGPEVKPLLTGLLSRNGPPSAELRDVVDSYVVQVSWKALQRSRHGGLTAGGLDRQLDRARREGDRVKLRVLAGVRSPGWAKRLGGRPVRLRDPHDHQTGTVPRFWTPAFGRAYADLQRRLAARYDDDPVLAEVVVSRCTTFYAEPYVRQTAARSSRTALLRAGYTQAADKACHRREIDAHRVWKQTRSGLAMNPAQLVTAGAGRTVDDRFTSSMMRYCVRRLGQRCVLQNNSIRSPIASLDPDPRHPHYRRMYRAMGTHARAQAFQTATAERMGSCPRTLDWAADRGAAYVEIPWNAVAAGCTRHELATAARRLG